MTKQIYLAGVEPMIVDRGRDTGRPGAPRTDPDRRSLAHPVLLSDRERPSVELVRTLAHPWNTRSPALSRVRVKWESVLLEPQPSLLTLRRRCVVFVRMIHRYYAAV